MSCRSRRLRRASDLSLLLLVAACTPSAIADEPVADLGSRLELFVDRHAIAKQDGIRLVLHPPRPAEVAIRFDEPWEGPYSAYVTVLLDDGLYRMYYRGWSALDGDQLTCYAESNDGITWTKPRLGLVAFNDSTENNILLRMPGNQGTHNFAPFLDSRDDVPEDERYKALGGQPPYAFASADGIRWRRLSPEPVMTRGAFDSQNLAFFDSDRGEYRAYIRIVRDGVRDVATATSVDFRTWSEPTPVVLNGGTTEHFYTNATTPYFRATHFDFMFPKRFVPERRRLGGHPESGVSDAVFLSSRDGVHFDREFREAFIRPGRDPLNWGDRSTMPAWGVVPTGPDEMSIYFSQHYRLPSAHLRRGVLRLDGIASARAEGEPGELLTKPFKFTGRWLVLNFATSAAGSIRVEIQDSDGRPIPGFALDDASTAYGDEIAEAFSWSSGPDVSTLSGRDVQLRFVLQDADLYSYRFSD